jgi:6-phosphogluconolactonase
MQPEIKRFDATEWPMKAAGLIQERINNVLSEQGKCSVMLTGGRSAERLYKAWNGNPAFQQMTGVRFFFGDERCVPPDHAESNFGMAMLSLFQHGVPEGCSVLRMEADAVDRVAAAQRYEDVLPESIDVLLLGVGEDGHIASLFPGSSALHEIDRQILFISGPKPPYERLTITPPVIAKARSVFVLARGDAKADVLARLLQGVVKLDTMPASLVLGENWLLETSGHNDIKENIKILYRENNEKSR